MNGSVPPQCQPLHQNVTDIEQDLRDLAEQLGDAQMANERGITEAKIHAKRIELAAAQQALQSCLMQAGIPFVAPPFQHFLLEGTIVGVPIDTGDEGYTPPYFQWVVGDFNRDGMVDLLGIKVANTTNGQIEVHVLDGSTNFQSFLLQTATPITETDGGTYKWVAGDFNRDGIVDLLGIRLVDEFPGQVEVDVLNGATNFQSFLLQTKTPLFDGGAYKWVAGDFNKDGMVDLLGIKVANTTNGQIEVRVLDGFTNFQSFLLQTATPITETDGGTYEWVAGDFNRDGIVDLLGIKLFNTASGQVEVHVLNGATNFQSFLLQIKTPITEADGATNFQWVAADVNRDGIADLMGIKLTNTGTGLVEVHVLNGATNFQSFLLQTGTPISVVVANTHYLFAAGDVNHDGIVDLISMVPYGVFLNDGSSNFQNQLPQLGEWWTMPISDALHFQWVAGDVNGDGIAELIGIGLAQTGTGQLEVQVFEGTEKANQAPAYQLLFKTVTTITDMELAPNFCWAAGDVNGDGIADLIGIQVTNTASGQVEVHMLNGATHFQSFLLQTKIPITEADGAANFHWTAGDWDRDGRVDLIGVKVANTGTGQVEVHILSGASNYQTFLLQTETPITEADGAMNFRWVAGDFNKDGIVDLLGIKVTNTPHGQLEVHVLDGWWWFMIAGTG